MPMTAPPGSASAILFDLDGTLVDSAPATARALNQMLGQRGAAPVDVASVRPWVSLGGEAILRAALDHQKDPVEDLDEFRAILRGQAVDPSDLYPGVSPALIMLKKRGYRVAVCTNKPEDIAVSYTIGLGIADHFDAVVGGITGRRLKPDPQLAHIALERLGVSIGSALFVGDSEIDAATARAAGLPFALATFGYPIGDAAEIRADARFDRFEEFPGLAESLLAAWPTC